MTPVKNSYFKKCLALFLLLSVIMLSVPASSSAQEEKSISIIVNGRLVEFPEQQPVHIDSSTMVPVKFAEEYGYQVSIKGSDISITGNNNTISFKIDSNIMSLNGKPVGMDAKVQLINKTPMVPLKYLSEPFGYTATYGSDAKGTVISLIYNDPVLEQKQKLLVSKMGLTDCLYPTFDDNYSNYYMMSVEEAIARGSGKDIKILFVASNGSDAEISLLKNLVPSADISLDITLPEDLSGYHIVSIHADLWKQYDLDRIAKAYPSTIFIVTMDNYIEPPYNQPAIDNSDHFDAVRKLTQSNIITLGETITARMLPSRFLYDNVPVADLYVANNWGMGQIIAAGVFAILLETAPELDGRNFKSYLKKHSKTLTTIVQPREDMKKRIYKYFQALDAHLLFKSYDNDPQDLDTLNLSAYTGKGLKIALIDDGFDLKGLEKAVKAQYVVSKDKKFGYSDFYGKNSSVHGTQMLKALLQTAPDAEIYTILNGPWRGTFAGQDAQDIADALEKARALKVDIVSMSYSIYFNENENIKKAIRALTEQGILMSWFWSAEVNDNIFRSRSGFVGGDEESLGREGILMYGQFSTDYYKNLAFDLSISATAPKLAGILAQIREANSDITGGEIKNLLNSTGVKLSDTYLKGFNIMPNVERATRIAKQKLKVVSELNQEAPIHLSFDKSYDITVNGLVSKNVSSLDVESTGHFALMLSRDGAIELQPATQLVSAVLLKDSKNKYYIDSTFNGTIETASGTITLKVGINPINNSIKRINKIDIIYPV